MARGHGPLREIPLTDALVFAEHYEHVLEIETGVVKGGVLQAIDKIDFK